MTNFDNSAKENIKEIIHQNWLRISDHPNRILITRGSGFGKKILYLI